MEPFANPASAPTGKAPGPIEQAGAVVDAALHAIETTLALLGAELRLARSSAFMLMWLAFALVFLGVGAWLFTSAALAAGLYQLTGNVLVGIAGVALANLVGLAAVLMAMRRHWRDLTLPRTRRLLDRTQPAST